MGYVSSSQLKEVQQKLVDNLKNGKLIPSQAVSAKTLDPVSDDSGVIQDEPFVIQGTGTANGTTSVDTGSTAKQLEKRGNSFAVNQLLADNKKSGSITPGGSTTYSTVQLDIDVKANTKYLIIARLKNAESRQLRAYVQWGSSSVYGVPSIDVPANSTKLCVWIINHSVSDVRIFVGFSDIAASQNLTQTWTYSDLSVINLTQWFNGNIPQDILDDPKRFFNYYGGSLAYNAGTLTNATGRYLVNKHRNAWDEVWEVGSINDTTGANTNATNQIRSKNYIPVVSNATYYIHIPNGNGRVYYYDENKKYLETINVSNNTFVIYPDCRYIRFRSGSGYGSTYSNNITISLYYSPDEGGADYDQYYPYEAPSVYDTGNEVLRSAGSVRDVKVPDGTITRNVGTVDLGTLTYEYNGSNIFVTTATVNTLKNITTSELGNLSCVKYTRVTITNMSGSDKCIGTTGQKIYIKDTSAGTSPAAFKTAMNGVYLNYELATPTIESGTAFSPTIEIDDYGTNEWLKTYDAATPANNEYTAVPQACEIFYPADISLFIDTLGQRSDIGWDAAEIVSQEELDEVVNGVRSVAKADLAENLETDLGSEQTYEHLYLSGLNIGVENGDYAKNTNIKGKSYAINQLVQNGNFENTSNWSVYRGTLSVQNNIGVMTCSVSNNDLSIAQNNITINTGQKYLIKFDIKAPKTITGAFSFDDIYVSGSFNATANVKTTIYYLYEATRNGTKFRIYFNRNSVIEVNEVTEISNVALIDLTQFFGSNANIPADLISHPETFFNYYQGDLSYNTGALKDSKPVALISTNANVWDEQYVTDGYYNASGVWTAGSYLSSKNPIRVIPNTQYYFGGTFDSSKRGGITFWDKDMNFISRNNTSQTVTTPSNCEYIHFNMASSYGTTYNNDICINISDSSFNGTYVSHVSRRYPLTLPVMRSAGSVQDDTSKVKVGIETVAIASMYTSSGNTNYDFAIFTLTNAWGSLYNTLNDKNVYYNGHSNFANVNIPNDLLVYSSGSKQLAISVTKGTTKAQAEALFNGMIFNYELATPVDQEGITLPENVEVFTNGTLTIEYEDGYEVPCDAEFLYQVNIKRFVEGLGSREDINWNKDEIVSQTELANAVEAGVDALQDKLEKGTVVTGKALAAKNLEPVSQASGSIQTAPFINQGTATNNNDSQAEVDTGTLGQHLEKLGNVVCVNQFVTLNNTATNNGITLTKNNNGTYTASGTASAQAFFGVSATSVNLIAGHKYLFHTLKADANLKYFCYVSTPYFVLYDEYQVYTVGSTSYSSIYFAFSVQNGYQFVSPITFMPFVIDLTQWFGGNGNIPTDLLLHPSNFYRYYQGSLAYNAGQLVASNGRYLVNGGQNVWNEDWVVGSLLYDGSIDTTATTRRTTKFIQVIPNRTYIQTSPDSGYNGIVAYYDVNKTFIIRDTAGIPVGTKKITTPTNAKYMRVTFGSTYGTTYNHDITISLYYEGEDYSTYVPYEAPKVYDTGTEELLSVRNIQDYKTPDGIVHKLVGKAKLKDLTWTYNTPSGGQAFFQTTGIKTLIRKPASNSLAANGWTWMVGYTGTDVSGLVYNVKPDKAFGIEQTGELDMSDSAYTDPTTFKNHFGDNDYIYFELATHTTEQGTPFSENMDINDMGNMAWYSAYTDETTNTPVSVPQGCKIFYPAWYAGFLDSVGQREDIDWSPEQIVSQEELGVVDTKIDTNYAIIQNAIGGTLRQCLCVKESLDFDNTDFKDLGSLTWTKASENYHSYYANIININQVISENSFAKLICTKYKQSEAKYGGSYSFDNTKDKTIWKLVSSGGNAIIVITDTTYTDATTFKNAMKGVLLAYEKASS